MRRSHYRQRSGAIHQMHHVGPAGWSQRCDTIGLELAGQTRFHQVRHDDLVLVSLYSDTYPDLFRNRCNRPSLRIADGIQLSQYGSLLRWDGLLLPVAWIPNGLWKSTRILNKPAMRCAFPPTSTRYTWSHHWSATSRSIGTGMYYTESSTGPDPTYLYYAPCQCQ